MSTVARSSVRPWALPARVRTWGAVGAITILAAIPRLARPDLTEYKLDEALAVLNGLAILRGLSLPLVGQGSSLAGAAQAPLFYYLVAVLLWIGGDPQRVVQAIGLANAVGAGLSYLAFRRAVGDRPALVAALLLAGGSWAIVFSRKIWPNDLLAPLAVIALWGLLRAVAPGSQTGLGWSWLAVGLMGALNLSAWPELIVPALVQLAVPTTRRGRALATSLAGLLVPLGGIALLIGSFRTIAADLVGAGGARRVFDLTPLGYIIQLVRPDAFQVLAGPNGAAVAAVSATNLLGPLLQGLLLLGALAAAARTLRQWRAARRPVLTESAILLLWWLAPALAALDRPVPVYVHHFLPTMPVQFLFTAMGLDGLIGRIGALRRLIRPRDRLPHGARWVAAGVQRLAASAATARGAIAAVLALAAASIQLRAFRVFLAFIALHPTGTFVGVPLGASMIAAERAAAEARGRAPVYILSDGDLVGVDTTPTVIASLARGAPLQYVDADETIPFPARGAAVYFAAPDTAADISPLLARLAWPSGPRPTGPALPGGYLRLAATAPGARLPSGWRTTSARLEDGSIITAYAAPRQLHPGARAEIDVLWQIGRPPPEPSAESIFVHLVDDRGHVQAGADLAPLPTATWIRGAWLLNRFAMEIPRQLPPGRYWLDIGRYRRPAIVPLRVIGADGRIGPTSIRVGPTAVPPPTPTVGPLTPLGAVFGGVIRLEGWRVDQSADRLEVLLLWRAVAPPPADYTVFVHLIGPNGHLAAQDDRQPRSGQFPTSTWESGDQVLDTHAIALRDISPGTYRLEVGLYTLPDGRRLPAGPTTALALGDVRVPPRPAR
ncbi:MAG: glycosyltransferase family 39 protein [Chloroflexi bacterium]|nr:glycosyltransferase family 39 protein [Chloroflexota bacterium]